jgi:hypothetical protein
MPPTSAGASWSSSVSLRAIMLKTIKNYSTRIEADVARIALDSAGIPAVVVGVGAGMEGGTGGVQLLVEDDLFGRAQEVLGDS